MATTRSLLLGAAFVLTLAASVLDWPGQETGREQEQDAGAATPVAAASAPAAAASASTRARAAGASRMQPGRVNAFASYSWLPPAPKVKALPPPAPRAPALPFVYLGKMQDGASVTAFVSQGGRNHVLHSGDTLAGYRVESISATDITFVYLALGEKQRLIFGSEN